METINLEDKIYFVGYRVLTKDLKSLGLRRNPNILQYPIGEWYFLPKNYIIEGKDDFGGIWVARTFGNARKLSEYMKEKHDTETRLFKTAIDRILFENSYRIKTNGIYLFEELTFELN